MDDLEKCPYCGMRVEEPCDEPPPDYCHQFYEMENKVLDKILGKVYNNCIGS